MTSSPLAHAIPPTRKAAGVTSLVFGILASIPLGLFLGAEVGLADTRTVDENLAWGNAVVTLGRASRSTAASRPRCWRSSSGWSRWCATARVGKGCGLAGLLLGGVVLVWLAIAVVPQLGGAGFALAR